MSTNKNVDPFIRKKLNRAMSQADSKRSKSSSFKGSGTRHKGPNQPDGTGGATKRGKQKFWWAGLPLNSKGMSTRYGSKNG